MFQMDLITLTIAYSFIWGDIDDPIIWYSW